MSTILFSGNDGDTFRLSNVAADSALPIDLVRAGDSGPFFALRDSHVSGPSIYRSPDGQTWDSFNDPLRVAGVTATPGSLGYDFITDSLFISYQDNTAVFMLKKATQAIAASVNGALAAATDILGTGAPPFWIIIPSPGSVGKGPRSLVSQKKGV